MDHTPKQITEITRRALMECIATITWSGRLNEVEFLSRLYDLSVLPSTDFRADDAAGDIHIHRVTFNDWSDDWIFHDDRFNLFEAPDDELLRFLCETVHPAVRPDATQAGAIVATYNQELAGDGYALVEVQRISGRPVYGVSRVGIFTYAFTEPTGWAKVDRQLQEARSQLQSASTEEHFQGVGLLCREVLISLAQQVFDPQRHPMTDGVAASETDAKRMLEAVIAHELSGSSQEELRACARATVKLAPALQHKRTADFRMAALCLEATCAVVNYMTILAGRRH